MTPAGFPHSDTHGSVPAFGYPWLFADRCVLLRLPVPRHPPCALLSLTCQYLFRYCLCQSCSNHFFWVLLHSHTLQFNVSVLFCLFRETIACFSGFTFFRFFFIQFSKYTPAVSISHPLYFWVHRYELLITASCKVSLAPAVSIERTLYLSVHFCVRLYIAVPVEVSLACGEHFAPFVLLCT